MYATRCANLLSKRTDMGLVGNAGVLLLYSYSPFKGTFAELRIQNRIAF